MLFIIYTVILQKVLQKTGINLLLNLQKTNTIKYLPD